MSHKFKTIILSSLALGQATLAQGQEHRPEESRAHHPAIALALSIPKTGPEYAFETTYSDEHIDAHAFVNPQNPSGERLTVTKPARSDWNDDFKEALTELDQGPFEEFWCSDFLAFIGADAHPVIDDGNVIVFAFTPQPTLDDDEDDRKFLSEMIAHITINPRTGTVQNFEMRNRKPFKPIFIAKIKSFEMKAQCQASPDGRTFVADLTTHLLGKIALKKVEEREHRTISNLFVPK